MNIGRRVNGYKSPGYRQCGSLFGSLNPPDFPRFAMPFSIPSRFTLVANPPSSYPSWNTKKKNCHFLSMYNMFRMNKLQSSGCWVVEKHPSADTYSNNAPPGGSSLKPLAKNTSS